jgi:sugar O-acyltransferase (sialic acid O-acetyltransferase NeuD family)
MNLHILGKSNNMISLLLDIMYERYNTVLSTTIVCNIPVGESPSYALEKAESISCSSVSDSEWSGEYEMLLLGVIRVQTKSVVYKSFKSTHSICENDFDTIIHPSSIVSIQSVIGTGVSIGPGSIIAPYVEIENMVSINRKVSIGHHTVIGKFSTLNPGCNIAGGSNIGSYTTIGMGSNIFDGVNIGNNTIIGAGSTVTRDIPDNVVAYGVPARIIKENL